MLQLLRVLVWAPFGLVTSKPLMFGAFLVGSFHTTGTFFNVPLFLVMMVVFGAALPIELRLRPEWAPRAGQLPPAEKPIRPVLARVAVRIRGRAPKPRVIAKQLAPELRSLLARPVDRQPEAVLFQDQLARAS